jgi:hypothetical protein
MEESIMERVPKTKRKRKPVLLTPVVIEEAKMAKAENEDLNLHVSLCEQRYKELERRLEALDERLTKVETQIADIKANMATGFGEIKLLLERQSNHRFVQIVATVGTITAAVVAAIGYSITH